MKKVNRLLPAILATSLLTGSLAACTQSAPSGGSDTPPASGTAQSSSTSSAAPASKYATKEKIRFMCFTYTREFQKDDPIRKYVEETFNVELDIATAPHNNYSQQIEMMMTSGDLPDYFKYGISGVSETRNVNDFVNAGMFMNLDEPGVLDSRPNLKAYLDEMKEPTKFPYWERVEKEGTYFIPMDGGYYGHGMFYREDWLEQLNIPVPTTLDQLYDAMQKIKESGIAGEGYIGITAPGFWWFNHIASCFGNIGLFQDYIDDNGKVVGNYTADSYREFLRYNNRLYQDGLLDSEIFTMTDAKAAEKFMNGKVAFMLNGTDGAVMNPIMDGLKQNVPDAKFGRIMRLPAGPDGSHQASGFPGQEISIINNKSSDEVKNRILDIAEFIASEEGNTYINWGVEGVDYDTVNGEKVAKDPKREPNLMYYWLRHPVDVSCIKPTDPNYEIIKYNRYEFLEEGVKDGYIRFPNPILATYSSTEFADTTARCSDIYSRYKPLFVTGETSIDTGWDAYVQEMAAAGYDDYIADLQKYVDSIK